MIRASQFQSYMYSHCTCCATGSSRWSSGISDHQIDNLYSRVKYSVYSVYSVYTKVYKKGYGQKGLWIPKKGYIFGSAVRFKG
jgi:hypothetical protein